MWVRNEKEIQELFHKWRGANGQVWEYVCGHGLLLVRFFRPQQQLNLFLLCADCRTIQFPSVGWQDINLQWQQKSDPKQNDEDFKFEIRDGERFYAACWGVSLIESNKKVFIDWPPEMRKKSDKYVLI